MPLPRLGWTLGLCVSALALAGLATDLLTYEIGPRSWLKYLRLFDLDQERNIPTWFSSFLLLSIGIVLAVIAIEKRKLSDRWHRYWGGLGIIFVMLSLDEFAMIHESAMPPLRDAFHFSGVLYFAWVVPAAFLLAGFAALYARFTLALPPRTRNLFVLSAFLYVGGAFGVEMIGGAYATAHETANLAYALITCVEETLEMTGLAVFLCTLVDYIRSYWGRLELSFRI